MAERDEIGQKQLDELIAHRELALFNDYEQRYLKTLIGLKYQDLSKRQKAVVARLYTFWTGLH